MIVGARKKHGRYLTFQKPLQSTGGLAPPSDLFHTVTQSPQPHDSEASSQRVSDHINASTSPVSDYEMTRPVYPMSPCLHTARPPQNPRYAKLTRLVLASHTETPPALAGSAGQPFDNTNEPSVNTENRPTSSSSPKMIQLATTSLIACGSRWKTNKRSIASSISSRKRQTLNRREANSVH